MENMQVLEVGHVRSEREKLMQRPEMAVHVSHRQERERKSPDVTINHRRTKTVLAL